VLIFKRERRPAALSRAFAALGLWPAGSIDDRPRPGKEPTITPEAKAWLVSLACEKAKEHGYPHELWTTRLLARHVCGRGQPTCPRGKPAYARLGMRYSYRWVYRNCGHRSKRATSSGFLHRQQLSAAARLVDCNQHVSPGRKHQKDERCRNQQRKPGNLFKSTYQARPQ
jgi:hypothetical protein